DRVLLYVDSGRRGGAALLGRGGQHPRQQQTRRQRGGRNNRSFNKHEQLVLPGVPERFPELPQPRAAARGFRHLPAFLSLRPDRPSSPRVRRLRRANGALPARSPRPSFGPASIPAPPPGRQLDSPYSRTVPLPTASQPPNLAP